MLSKNIFIISFIVAIALWVLFIFLYQLTELRIFHLLGGTYPFGLIHCLIYLLFFYGFLQIIVRSRKIKKEQKSFSFNFLPATNDYRINANDVDSIRNNVLQHSNSYNFILTDLIRKACNKYLSNNSVAETMSLVNRQSEMNYENAEIEFNNIRYITNAIPSLGFIGTVIGISQAIGSSLSIQNGKIEPIVDLLYVAFDTTLIALVLGLILSLSFSRLRTKEATFHNKTEEYVLENLVNRISQ